MTLAGVPPGARGRAVGAAVGTLFGAGWWAYGLQAAPLAVQVIVGAAGLVVALLLLRQARRLMFAPREPARAGGPPRRQGAAFAFAALVVAEVVALNLAVAGLSPAAMHVYGIPAISAVVGLHFLPMAWIFKRRELTVCGLAMLGGALLAVTALAAGVQLVIVTSAEGLANGAILWLTTASNLRAARPRPA